MDIYAALGTTGIAVLLAAWFAYVIVHWRDGDAVEPDETWL